MQITLKQANDKSIHIKKQPQNLGTFGDFLVRLQTLTVTHLLSLVELLRFKLLCTKMNGTLSLKSLTIFHVEKLVWFLCRKKLLLSLLLIEVVGRVLTNLLI